MRTIVWLCSLAFAASAWGQGLRFEQKLTEAHGPSEVHVAQPVFKGGDSATAERLNAWVKRTVGVVSCPSFGNMPSSYSRDLTVDRLSADYLVISDAAEELCGGSAHDNSWKAQFVIPLATGETLDVWSGLSEASQDKLRKTLIAHARKQFGNDECGRIYKENGWLEQLSLHFTSKGVIVSSDFPYVARACDSQVTLSVTDFRSTVEASPDVRAFLDRW
ncbi:MAG: hypothetical protein QM723_07205 [Myxococcaceae bacterium]